MCIFFFFKQKTAYEMRISDWSSDVCSSDLAGRAVAARIGRGVAGQQQYRTAISQRRRRSLLLHQPDDDRLHRGRRLDLWRPGRADHHAGGGRLVARSEEHTSELQSLMRISYAVFCLKKKK